MKWLNPILVAILLIVTVGCIAGVEVDVNTSVYVKVGGRIWEWLQ